MSGWASCPAWRCARLEIFSQPIGNPDEWVEHLKWLEDGFKSGARCYGSCLSTVAGGIFNLERGLNVPQDEDITHPEGFFRGMPTWDKVMALPYQDRMRALRDPEIRKALSPRRWMVRSSSRVA
jgi:hypothetical protein